MSTSASASRILAVINSSAWLGSATPDGWLCARITAAAFSFSARFTTSRGCTEAPSMVPRNISSRAMSRWRLSRNKQPNDLALAARVVDGEELANDLRVGKQWPLAHVLQHQPLDQFACRLQTHLHVIRQGVVEEQVGQAAAIDALGGALAEQQLEQVQGRFGGIVHVGSPGDVNGLGSCGHKKTRTGRVSKITKFVAI